MASLLALVRGFFGTAAAVLEAAAGGAASPRVRKGKPQQGERGLTLKQLPWYKFGKTGPSPVSPSDARASA